MTKGGPANGTQSFLLFLSSDVRASSSSATARRSPSHRVCHQLMALALAGSCAKGGIGREYSRTKNLVLYLAGAAMFLYIILPFLWIIISSISSKVVCSRAAALVAEESAQHLPPTSRFQGGVEQRRRGAPSPPPCAKALDRLLATFCASSSASLKPMLRRMQIPGPRQDDDLVMPCGCCRRWPSCCALYDYGKIQHDDPRFF
jgi:hypothetical protein